MTKNINKRKHLDYIQNTIMRMSDKADMIKKMYLCIMTMILFASILQNKFYIHHRTVYATMVLFSITSCIFMYYDAYFLELERIFIKKYNQIRAVEEENIDYNINIFEIKPEMKFCKTLFSRTVALYYVLIFVVYCGALCLRNY